MYEDLESGKASPTHLASLVQRLRAVEVCTDIGSLLPAVSLLVDAILADQPHEGNVGIRHAAKELNDTAWILLRRPPSQSSSDSLPSLLEALVVSTERLVDAAAETLREDDLESLTSAAVSGCECVWSMPDASTGHDNRGLRFRLSLSLLEGLVLAGIQAELHFSSNLVTSIAGVLLAMLCDTRASSDQSQAARVIAFRTVGSLAARSRTRAAGPDSVWKDVCEEIARAVCEDADPAAAGAAAQAAGALLDALRCPGAHLGSWLPLLLRGAQDRLETPEVASWAAVARQFLSLLGDAHRFVPEGSAHDAVAQSVVGEGRFNRSCSLIYSAGASVSLDQQLVLGVLEAWEGVIAFLKGIPSTEVEAGFEPWAASVAVYLARVFSSFTEEEIVGTAVSVLGDLLQLAVKVRGCIAQRIVSIFQQHPSLLRRACGDPSLPGGARTSVQNWVAGSATALGLSTAGAGPGLASFGGSWGGAAAAGSAGSHPGAAPRYLAAGSQQQQPQLQPQQSQRQRPQRQRRPQSRAPQPPPPTQSPPTPPWSGSVSQPAPQRAATRSWSFMQG